jgi:hypothetical protein
VHPGQADPVGGADVEAGAVRGVVGIEGGVVSGC